MVKIKVPGFIKIIPHTLKQTGRYCDGRFDPNHIDFESFCGLSHTKRTALPLALATIVYTLVMTSMFALIHIHAVLITYSAVLPFMILLVIGIRREKPLIMLPFIVIMFVSVFVDLILIALMFIALFTPNSYMFNQSKKYMMVDGDVMDIESAILLTVILTTFNCTMGGYTAWSMWIHLCYIRGCKQMAEEEQKKEISSQRCSCVNSVENA